MHAGKATSASALPCAILPRLRNDDGCQPHVRQWYSFGLSAITAKNQMMSQSPRKTWLGAGLSKGRGLAHVSQCNWRVRAGISPSSKDALPVPERLRGLRAWVSNLLSTRKDSKYVWRHVVRDRCDVAIFRNPGNVRGGTRDA